MDVLVTVIIPSGLNVFLLVVGVCFSSSTGPWINEGATIVKGVLVEFVDPFGYETTVPLPEMFAFVAIVNSPDQKAVNCDIGFATAVA